MSDNKKMTADDIVKAIHLKHSCKTDQGTIEWVVFDEFRTGSRYRYIDVLAVNCWKSYGNVSIVAYEIKISKADFKKDLDNFEKKQGETFKHSTEFYYVCPHGMILPDEVPEQCGLYWVNSAMQLRNKKRATIRSMPNVPPSMFKSFMSRKAKFFLKPEFPMKMMNKNITQEEFSSYVAQELENRRWHLIEKEVEKKVKEETERIKEKYKKAIDFVTLILTGRQEVQRTYYYHDTLAAISWEDLKEKGQQLYSLLNSGSHGSLFSQLEIQAQKVIDLVNKVKDFDKEIFDEISRKQD
jgi:hypothetical protein